MEQKYFWLSLVALSGLILISGCVEEQTSDNNMNEMSLMIEYPEEYMIYLDYAQTIGNIPRISDSATIEATVISLTNSEVCPYNYEEDGFEEQECKIEPYPKDIGFVRIDKIINYVSYTTQTEKQTDEHESGNASNNENSDDIHTSSGYEGIDYTPKSVEYDTLKVGEEILTRFMLTARPAKIKYVSIAPKEVGNNQEAYPLSEAAAEQTVTYSTASDGEPITNNGQAMQRIYKPIPKEENYFVFTTKIIEYPKTELILLHGLKIGDKFRAKIKYNGTLFIEEYEIIS